MSVKKYIKRGISYILHGQPHVVSDLHIHYSASNQRLKEKRIVVTGGTRGLGFAMAQKFISEGASVLITGRNEELLKEKSLQLSCAYLVLDMQRTEFFDDFISNACRVLGSIDVLVNNAGVSLHERDYSEVTQNTFDIQINTNLKGPFFLTQKFLNYMIENKRRGNVLFVSSETGTTVDLRPYGWTKAAVNSMVQGLAYRVKDEGIRINAICPGVTATEMTGYQGDDNLFVRGVNKRIYLPEEMAETATFLISDIASLINGQIIVCNEGNTINARWK